MKYYVHTHDQRYRLTTDDDSKKDTCRWLHLIDPTEEEIRSLSQKYKVPQSILSSVADPGEVARSDGKYSSTYDLFILRYPVEVANDIYETRPLAMINTEEVVITVKYHDDRVFSCFLENKGHRLIEDESFPKEKILVDLAYHICKSYIELTKNINARIEELEKDMARSTKSETIQKLISLSRSLIRFSMATENNEYVLHDLFHLAPLSSSPSRNQLLNDLKVESTQARVMVKEASVTVEKLSDLYSSLVGNNLNDVMKTLTSMTILLTVPTIIGGYWGMNTSLPLSDEPYAFWWLLGLTLAVIVLMYFYLKKRDYL